MLQLFVAAHFALFTVVSRLTGGHRDPQAGADPMNGGIMNANTGRRGRHRRGRVGFDRGQATTEYALVLLGAATVALLLVGWAVKTGKVAALLDAVLDKVLGQV